MAMIPPAIVPAPARTPLPHGLFSVVPFRDGAPERWQGGAQAETIGCPGDLQGFAFDCPPEEGIDLYADLQGGQVLAEGTPFTVQETYTCSPIGNTADVAERVARGRLETWEEMRVEQALATGAFGQVPDLTTATALTSASSWEQAIGSLEALMGTTYGSLGILHVSRFTATLLAEAGLVSASGQRLRTELGTPVVAGSGYGFDGIVLTPTIVGYRSEITAFGSLDRTLDRSNNNFRGIAQRDYLLLMDPCEMFSIEVEGAPTPVTPVTPDTD